MDKVYIIVGYSWPDDYPSIWAVFTDEERAQTRKAELEASLGGSYGSTFEIRPMLVNV